MGSQRVEHNWVTGHTHTHTHTHTQRKSIKLQGLHNLPKLLSDRGLSGPQAYCCYSFTWLYCPLYTNFRALEPLGIYLGIWNTDNSRNLLTAIQKGKLWESKHSFFPLSFCKNVAREITKENCLAIKIQHITMCVCVLMWSILKSLLNLLHYWFCCFMWFFFFFWLWGMWDLSLPTRIESHPLQCKAKRWTTREVPSSVVYFLTCSLLLYVTSSWS